jgi:ribonuclease P protein component
VLPAAARMRRPAEFAAALRCGARAGSRALTVHVAPTTASPGDVTADGVRIGFVVPRAVGSAVVRNGVRRRLRHVLRALVDGLPRGVDVVIRVHPAAAGMSSVDLGRELDRALERALARPPGPRP